MFGTPQLVDDDTSVFQTVWKYVIKSRRLMVGRKPALHVMVLQVWDKFEFLTRIMLIELTRLALD
jgi:hypothetical protein